jgi:hypothetical protein
MASQSPTSSLTAPAIENFPPFSECFAPRRSAPPTRPAPFRSDVEVAALLYPAHIDEDGNSLDDGESSGSSYGSGGSVCGGGGGGGGGVCGSARRRRRARWPLSPAEANVDNWCARAHPQLRTPPREHSPAATPTARGRAATGAALGGGCGGGGALEEDSEEEDLAQRLGSLWLAGSPSTPLGGGGGAPREAGGGGGGGGGGEDGPPSPILAPRVEEGAPPSPICRFASPAAPASAPRSGGGSDAAGGRRLTYSVLRPDGALLFAAAEGHPAPSSAALHAAQVDPALSSMRNAAARCEYRRWLASRGAAGGGGTGGGPVPAPPAARAAAAAPLHAAQAAFNGALQRSFSVSFSALGGNK